MTISSTLMTLIFYSVVILLEEVTRKLLIYMCDIKL